MHIPTLRKEKSTYFDVFKATQMVIGAGYEDAAAHQADERVGIRELRYTKRYKDTVDLIVRPTDEMTWETWRYALLGVGGFMQDWEYVELSFDVVVLGVGHVGAGKVYQEAQGG